MSEGYDTCGAPTQGGDGPPCQHPTTDDGDSDRCWIDAHNDADPDAEQPGRPSSFSEEKQEAIYAAVGSGLKVNHVAAAAGISNQTLRRWTCCIDDLSDPVIDSDSCDFCEGYVRAHGGGAREVLEECSPEFRASASYGYVKTEKQEHTGEDGGPMDFNINWVDGDGDD